MLRPLADNAIRVRFSVEGAAESPSLILTEKISPPDFSLDDTPDSVTILLPRMRATVSRATGALRFHDAQARLLLAERPATRLLRATSLRGEPSHEISQTFESPAG